MNALSNFRRTYADPSLNGLSNGDRILELPEILDFNFRVQECTASSYERIYFGMPVSEAVLRGFKITARGYFDSTESPIANHTAETLKKLAAQRETPARPRLLDLFSGSGQTAAAFIRAGFHVESSEIDPLRAWVSTNNIRKSGMETYWNLNFMSALRLLQERIEQRAKYDAVFLDPPWAGRYNYDLGREFRLSDMAPSGAMLIPRALALSDVVALKCPQNISLHEIENLCRQYSLFGHLEYQWVAGFPRELNQATVYFVKRGHSSHLLKFSFDTVTLSPIEITKEEKWQ